MKKTYSKSSRQGLPGGPNEMFEKVKGIIVSQRGQWDFPGMNTMVPTDDGRITMRGVPYPVYGQDETGYGQMMYPNQEYQFPGKNVLELPMAQVGLQVPIQQPDALRVHMNINPNAEYMEKKKSDVLDLDNTLDYLVETRGGTRDLWGHMADTIGYHESGHTMDPLQMQNSGGPGRGIFQFEAPSLITAQNRYQRISDRLNLKPDPKILSAKSALELSPEQQYSLFLINLSESSAKLKDYADNKLPLVDLWLQGHKKIEKGENRGSFRTSVQKAKDESIQKGYDSFKQLGGALPRAQMLGEFNPQSFQPNPITGLYNWEKPRVKPTLSDFEPKQKAAPRSSTSVATKSDPVKAARQINSVAAEEYERNRQGVIRATNRPVSVFRPGAGDPEAVMEYTGVPSAVRIAQNPESVNDFLSGVDQLILGSSPVSGMMGMRRDFTPEETQALLDYSTVATMGLPLVRGAGKLGAQGLKQTGKYLTQGPLRNTYKYNPWAFKPNESNWYRQVGKSAIDDALETGLVREIGEEVSPRMWGEFQNQIKRLQGDDAILDYNERYMQQILAGRRPNSPYFAKGKLFYPMDKKVTMTKSGKISKNPAAKGTADYLIETDLPNESFQPAYVKGMYLGVPEEIGSTAILKPNPELRSLENFNLYKKNWWQGYKPINTPKQLPGSPNALIGNNGMFDMTNPNIYKALAPVMGIGAGAYGVNQMQDAQPMQKFGGSLPTAGDPVLNFIQRQSPRFSKSKK